MICIARAAWKDRVEQVKLERGSRVKWWLNGGFVLVGAKGRGG